MRNHWMRLAGAVGLTSLNAALFRISLCRSFVHDLRFPGGSLISFSLAAGCTLFTVFAIWALFKADMRDAIRESEGREAAETPPTAAQVEGSSHV